MLHRRTAFWIAAMHSVHGMDMHIKFYRAGDSGHMLAIRPSPTASMMPTSFSQIGEERKRSTAQCSMVEQCIAAGCSSAVKHSGAAQCSVVQQRSAG
eukprot:365159-Chlamydomonas_euryale.AAC.21